MLTLEGTEGEFAFSLGAVVGIMLAGSWFTALYILPTLCVWFARRKAAGDADPQPNVVVRTYGAIIGKTLAFGPIIIIACYAAVVGAVSLFSSLKNEMFPLSERAEYMIYLNMPKGTAISATRAEALAVEEWLLDKEANPEVVNTTVFVGDGGPRFYLALNPADTDPSAAFILVNTQNFEGAVTAADRAWRYLVENHPSGRFKVKRLSMGGGESGIVEIKLSGPGAERLLMLADEVEVAFDAVPGISQNENDWGNKTLKIVIDVDQSKARELGVSSQEISDLMDTFYSGTNVSTYREGDQSIPIAVRAEERFRSSLEELAGLAIPAEGQLISLDQVATFDPQLEFSQMRRENQVRLIKISGKSETLAANRVLDLIRPTLNQLNLDGGYKLEIAGETENSAEVNEKLSAGMPLALMVMLVALMFQFNSIRRVLLTFMTVPLIIIGAPLALLATGRPLSFFAILGLISLAGIIINNAIVLIDQIDIEREAMALKEAIIEAAKKAGDADPPDIADDDIRPDADGDQRRGAVRADGDADDRRPGDRVGAQPVLRAGGLFHAVRRVVAAQQDTGGRAGFGLKRGLLGGHQAAPFPADRHRRPPVVFVEGTAEAPRSCRIPGAGRPTAHARPRRSTGAPGSCASAAGRPAASRRPGLRTVLKNG